MAVPARQSAQGQAGLPHSPDRLGGGHGARPRPPGRPEDDGCRGDGAGDRRQRDVRRPDPGLGEAGLGHHDVARYVRRRLADHAHHGPQDHRAGSAAGFRGGGDRRVDHVRHGVPLQGADLHDARHHLGDHGRRRDEALERGALGRGQEHRPGLVHHHAGRGPGRRPGLRPRQADGALVPFRLDRPRPPADKRVGASRPGGRAGAREGARPREPGAGPSRPRGGTAMQHREELVPAQPKRPEM
ncbi:hypothetical protein SGPA1_60034 [Streptomyces misionensis JCM 4497]